MIKSVTKINKKEGNIRKMGAEVIIEGNGQEILHELIGIIDTCEKRCPELLIKALQLQMEDRQHDN